MFRLLMTMRSIRKDMLAVFITLIALISQLFFGVVHSTSVWIASAGAVAQVDEDSSTYAFLQICSAGGLITLDGQETDREQANPGVCPVCASAATAPMLDGSEPELLLPVQAADQFQPVLQDQIRHRQIQSLAYPRGPPTLA